MTRVNVDELREALRREVAGSSTRRVAKRIGVDHTVLGGFLRESDPRTPHGLTMEKLRHFVAELGATRSEFDPASYAAGEFAAIEAIAQRLVDVARAAKERLSGAGKGATPAATSDVARRVAASARARKIVNATDELRASKKRPA